MRILKFGGSSLGSPQVIEQAIEIIQDKNRGDAPAAVIVSAFHGVTNTLLELASQAQRNEDISESLQQLENRHADALTQLTGDARNTKLISKTSEEIKALFEQLGSLLRGIKLLGECSLTTRDRIVCFGEFLSAKILATTLQNRNVAAEFVDATGIIKVEGSGAASRVNLETTYELIRKNIADQSTTYVITGFIASNEQGQVTTLGRGGSDYTASLVAAALDASCLEIWTDVDGVMTSDPRRVGKAFVLERLSFQEALELCHFGAKVIYPPTMQPVMSKGIPIRILNTFRPEQAGTIIGEESAPLSQPVTGISSINNIALVQVQGSGLIGVAGIAMRLFSALARHKINIILITQASSEHTICVAFAADCVEHAKKAIEDEFTLELRTGLVDPISVESDLAIVSIVGERMRHRVGISGKVFGSLGHNGINIRAIAQGSSERNISVVVNQRHETKALNALHEEFFAQVEKRANVFLIGVGLIGKELLKQVYAHQETLKKEHSIDLRIIGLANSSRYVIDLEGINTDDPRELLKTSGREASLEELTVALDDLCLSNTIVVDCTASESVARIYHTFLEKFVPVVTPNKKAQSGCGEYFSKLKTLARRGDIPFLYETSVGAGLPVINTLNDLLKSGDTAHAIEAVLSGTLSYLFNTWDGSYPFSEAVRRAQELGYTEPDPRDDLNGLDVARKILILARECGADLELKDVEIENLVPENAREANSVEEFYGILKRHDDVIEQRRATAASNGKRLCYIASYKNGKAQARLEEIDASHAFSGLSGTDNIVSLGTERYAARPLVIKGPGAGATVTAAGVLADVIRISRPHVG